MSRNCYSRNLITSNIVPQSHQTIMDPTPNGIDVIPESLDELKAKFIQAAVDNNVQIIDELNAQYNISANSLDKWGCSALIYASRNGNVNTVRRLIELDADVDYREPVQLSSALHYAAQCGHTRTAEALITLGNANKNIINREGKTPYDLAKDFGHGKNKIMMNLFCYETNVASTHLSENSGSSSSLDSNNNMNPSDSVNLLQNRMDPKRNIHYLPSHIYLEYFYKCGCYQFVSSDVSYGFVLIAKNDSPLNMIEEAFDNLSIPRSDIKGLVMALDKIIKNLNESIHNKFFIQEVQFSDTDNQRAKNYQAYLEWIGKNNAKIFSIIQYLANLYPENIRF